MTIGPTFEEFDDADRSLYVDVVGTWDATGVVAGKVGRPELSAVAAATRPARPTQPTRTALRLPVLRRC
ncbi:MAG: hypothetical protein WB802_11940 [Candidatus Dormiibacterota bacterium]